MKKWTWSLKSWSSVFGDTVGLYSSTYHQSDACYTQYYTVQVLYHVQVLVRVNSRGTVQSPERVPCITDNRPQYLTKTRKDIIFHDRVRVTLGLSTTTHKTTGVRWVCVVPSSRVAYRCFLCSHANCLSCDPLELDCSYEHCVRREGGNKEVREVRIVSSLGCAMPLCITRYSIEESNSGWVPDQSLLTFLYVICYEGLQFRPWPW